MRYGLLILMLALAGCQPNRPRPVATVTTAPVGSGESSHSRVEVVMKEAGSGGDWIKVGIVGRNCKVHFRRDALGVAAPAAAPPVESSFGGRFVNLAGRVEQVSDQALVLVASGGKRYWIPLSVILVVEIE